MLCLDSTFFQYNSNRGLQATSRVGLHYLLFSLKILLCKTSRNVYHCANSNIEKRAFAATYAQTLSFWFRYADDTVTTLETNHIDELHELHVV